MGQPSVNRPGQRTVSLCASYQHSAVSYQPAGAPSVKKCVAVAIRLGPLTEAALITALSDADHAANSTRLNPAIPRLRWGSSVLADGCHLRRYSTSIA